MKSGWVIVYLPGGDVYQMLDGAPPGRQSFKKRAIKTILTCVQLYWWLKG